MISLAILSACDASDMPIQHADSYDYITFAVQSQKILTRTNPYEAYDPQRHPATMGVFGYQDLNYSAPSSLTKQPHTTLPRRAGLRRRQSDGLIIPTHPRSTSLHTCLIRQKRR